MRGRRPASAPTRLRRGSTLVEVCIAFVLLAIFITGSLRMGVTTRDAYRSGARRAELEDSLQRATGRVVDLLRGTPAQAVTPGGLLPPNSTDTIDFAKAVDAVGGVVQWGPPQRLTLEPAPEDPDDGVDNDGDGLVDERRVVWIENPGLANERRTVLCDGVPETAPGEVPGNGLDDDGDGLADEAGLDFSFDGNRIVVELTVMAPGEGEQLLQLTSRRVVALIDMSGVLGGNG